MSNTKKSKASQEAIDAVLFDQAAEELLEVQEKLKPLKEREEELKAKLRNLKAGTFGKFVTESGLIVALQENRRIDPNKVVALYPLEVRPELYVTTPDVAKVRTHLAKVEIEKLTEHTGNAKVSVSRAG